MRETSNSGLLWLSNALALSLIASAGVANADIVANGSLTGPVANGAVPPSWSIQSGSPDTNDVSHNVGGATPFGATPSGPSPDGGTWVGLGRDGGFIETFGQTIGLTPGDAYTISWYAGNFGALTATSYVQPNAIEVLIDGVPVGAGSTLSLGPDWFLESLSFTASAARQNLGFRLFSATAGPSYLSIDGIGVTLAVPAIPEPGTYAMLLAGLGLLGFMARRKNQ